MGLCRSKLAKSTHTQLISIGYVHYDCDTIHIGACVILITFPYIPIHALFSWANCRTT